MKLFGWTLTRTPTPRPIVRPGATQGPQSDSGVLDRLNQLETNVERLQLDQSERQLAVLTALEKVMHQLRARERKREAENGDAPVAPSVDPAPGAPVGAYGHSLTTAHLAHRFRRF